MATHPEAKERPEISLLEQTPIIIEKIVLAATKDHLHWKPAADRWSISEVLAHLVETEQVFRKRAKAMVEEESPFLQSFDQNASYAAGNYSKHDAKEYLHQFCHERDLTVTFLRYLPAAAGARKARHSELGEITLNELVNEWAFHDLGHIRQISELYRSRAFYPHMGGFRKYYTVKP